ncbi:uncharacterized protein LOC113312422 [Papaver somniferum]|uniref:uncharacterized protein LOC113312422 n=1 Tax=Papaver somniferum TaxID=3469 RepID=UPI000E6F5556|nr:uncharacterized protein LOC113312422 [Papaver somniferum]
MDFNLLDFSVSLFWLEYKYLLPEFTYADVLRLFGSIVGEVRVVGPDGINPPTSSRYRTLVLIDVTTLLIEGIYVANAAGVTRWVGFFYEKQPYRLCPNCKVPDHEANPCADVTQRRIEMEEMVRGLGFPEPIYPQYRNLQEESQMFSQYGSQRRSRLRHPVVQQDPRPYDGMRIFLFSATDSDIASSFTAYADVSRPSSSSRHSSSRPGSTLSSEVASTSDHKKRARNTTALVTNNDNQDSAMTSHIARQEDIDNRQITSFSAIHGDSIWDIAAAHALEAQNHTDAWQQVFILIFGFIFIIVFLFALVFYFPILPFPLHFFINFIMKNSFLELSRAKSDNMKLYLTHTKYPHFWFHPSIGLSGGIAIAWKDGVDLEIMDTSADTIQAIIHTHDNHPDFLITFMYGDHDALDNTNQWNYLL